MGNEVIRWGVLGAARIARNAVCPAIRASRNGVFGAVASRDHTKAEEFARDTGAGVAWGSYDALLDDDDVEAIYIPLPNHLHHEWTIKAVRAGKHVLCEKPLALSAAECMEMEAAAREAGVVLMEAFMYRFHPRTEHVLALVRRGAIGAPKAISSVFTFPLTNPQNIRWAREMGGGALMDVGCYCVNVSRTVAGAEPIEVQAMANWAKTDVDEQMAGTLRFADGLLATFQCALTVERKESYVVAGSEGHLEIENAFVPGTDTTTIEEVHGRRERKSHAIAGADEYTLMVEHFADCVLEERPVRYPASEGAANMRVLEALHRSARNGGRPEQVRHG